MLYEGKFNLKDKEYSVAIVENGPSKRTDFYFDSIKIVNPTETTICCSVFEDLSNGTKKYFGDLDVYYAYERLNREARLHRFQDEEVEEYEEFEEGKILYFCNQKSDRFEYNYRSDNMEKVYRYMRSPESSIELNLTDMKQILTAPHVTLSYKEFGVDTSNFNADSLILSRIATVSELREKYDLSWLKGKEYVWVEDLEMLKKYEKEIRREAIRDPKNIILAVDTETTGLNIYNLPSTYEGRDELVSIIITWKEDFALYIPIRHKYETNLDELEVLEILEDIFHIVPILTQYGVFDYKVFLKYFRRKVKNKQEYKSFKLNIKQDLLIVNYIIQPNPHESIRGLKENVWKHLGIKQLSLSDLFPATKEGGKLEIRFELLGREISLIYACPDTDLLLKLYRKLKPQVPDVSLSIYNTEIKFMPIASSAEFYGLKINMREFAKEKKLCEDLVLQLQETVYKIAGYKFNLNSPDQVGNFLYNKLGCEILIQSKTNPNKGSTSSKALKNLSKIKLDEPRKVFSEDLIQYVYDEDKRAEAEAKGQEYQPEERKILEAKKLNELRYPAIAVLMEYRNYSKLLTSFFNSIEESNKGGRLYSWVNQTGAQTGRIISPLQTLPPFIKKMIIPDTSEHGFIVMDYKQVELRLMFGLAKETKMIEMSTDPSKDIHRIIAAEIYKKKIWEISKDLRGLAKGLNFGIPYALGKVNLALTLYGFPKNDEHKAEIIAMAEEDKRRYFLAMPRVERLFIDAKNFVLEHGCMYTKFGRGYFYPRIFEETDRGKIARMLRQAANGMIQGLGADIFKKGCTDFEEEIKKAGWDNLVEVHNASNGDYEGMYPLVRQAFFVHDELGTVYHKKTINPLQVIARIAKTMQMEIPGFPPLYIGPAVVANWGDAKKDKFEIPTELLAKWVKEVDEGMHTEPLENPEEWVYNEIVKYQEAEFFAYFDELKSKLRKEGKAVTADNIAKIFRHDTLSHDVMAVWGEKEFEKEIGRKGEHVEILEFAVKKYIEENDILSEDIAIPSGEDFVLQALGIVNEKDKTYDMDRGYESDKDELLEIIDDLDEFSNPLDVSIDYDFTDTMDDALTEDYFKYANGLFTKEEYDVKREEISTRFSNKVITMARQKIIDITLIDTETMKVLLNYLQEKHVDDGLYKITFKRGDIITETILKVDSIDDTFVDLILSKSNEKLNNIKLF